MNLDSLRKSSKNRVYREICENTQIIIPDSIGVTTLIFLKYLKRVIRLTGNEKFEILLDIADSKKLSIALIGASEEVLAKTKSKIAENYQNLKIVSAVSPPFDFEKEKEVNDRIVESVRSAHPDILFVALGCPKQEIWIAENMHSIGANINIGLGAVFDFYSGEKSRAPSIMQKAGLEWVWRLFSEPKRLFKRYLIEGAGYYIYSIFRITFGKY